MRAALLFPALAACLAAGPSLLAQDAQLPSESAAENLEPADAVEDYLRDRALDDLLSLYLLDQLRDASGSKRVELADRLGRHYADLLADAESPQRQREIEAQARELLSLVPDSDAFELRLTLHKASFLLAEDAAETHPLRLADPAALSEAQQTFRELEPSFHAIGRRVNDRVEALERMEDRSTRANIATIRDQLAEARRLRSLAMYYAGWSQYYQALINEDHRKAEAALRSFGWLLNAPGNREPTLDALPVSLLRYEHVSRAAMATALSLSIMGRDAEAIGWLEAIDNAGETPPAIRDELWARRIEVLGRAGRWLDLQRLVDQRRLAADPARATPLSVGEARLLAVVALEAMEQSGGSEVARQRDRLLEAIAQVALGDLVTQGEVGHVLDLVKRYGTTLIGDEGFVVLYVRALRAYERAREAHEQLAERSEASADEPTDDTTVANRYADAVRALEIAQVAGDAESFPEELTQSRMMEGLSLYYGGQLVKAGDAFEEVFRGAAEDELREEALWYAIVALDLAAERGTRSVLEQRDRLATLYLQSFPDADRAAQLLLRRVEDGLLTDEQAIAVLLDVPDDSPLYETARRHVSRLMYRRYRATQGPERDYAAARFMEVAEELIERDVAKVRTGSPDEAREAAEAVIVRVRQALDAALSVAVPDVDRAGRLLRLLEETASRAGASLEEIESELAYRKLQIALARGDEEAIAQAAAALSAAGGPHAVAGERLLYRRLHEQWRQRPNDPDLAVRMVAVASRVLDQFKPLEEHAGDATVAGILDTIAQAATVAAETGSVQDGGAGDPAMRDLAIATDLQLIDLGRQTAVSLQRLARNAEAAGDDDTALTAWRTLMSGLREGSDGWFEARVESIRVLADVDPRAARAALEQHRTLYPELGPEPWRSELLALESRLSGVRPATEPGGGG